jgi:hypothetical protein
VAAFRFAFYPLVEVENYACTKRAIGSPSILGLFFRCSGAQV